MPCTRDGSRTKASLPASSSTLFRNGGCLFEVDLQCSLIPAAWNRSLSSGMSTARPCPSDRPPFVPQRAGGGLAHSIERLSTGLRASPFGCLIWKLTRQPGRHRLLLRLDNAGKTTILVRALLILMHLNGWSSDPERAAWRAARWCGPTGLQSSRLEQAMRKLA